MPAVPKITYYRAVLIRAYLKDEMTSMDKATRTKINQYIYQKDNWVTDNEALTILGNSMPISVPDILIARMGKVLRYYKNLENCPATFQRRVSMLIIYTRRFVLEKLINMCQKQWLLFVHCLLMIGLD